MSQRERIEWVDFIRMFAIFGVILCHVTHGIYKMDLENISTLDIWSKIFVFSSLTLGRLGVPFFLMISGYLLLDKSYNPDKTKRFWTNNWLHLLICTEIWFLIYEVFLKFYLHQDISIFQVMGDLLFIHGISLSHVWYMPMILGMYLLIPMVAHALQKYEIKYLQFPLLFFIAFGFGFPFVNIISNVFVGKSLALQMSFGFSGGVYGIYLIIGYMIKQGWLKKIKTSLLILISVFFFLMGVALQIWSYENNYQYNMWYDCPFLLISSTAIFELFSRIKHVPVYYAVRWISCYSFAVYLIHNIFRAIVLESVASLPYMQSFKVIILWMFVILLSFLSAWLINKIPKVGKYILYTK